MALDDEDRDLLRDADPSDEGPRVEAGYRPAPPIVVLVAPSRGVVGDCRDCGKQYDADGKHRPVALFARSGGRERIVCNACSGKSHRATVERTRDVIRALTAAAACGNSGEEHDLLKQLEDLCGPHQAGETMRGIRDKIDQPAAKGARR